MPSANGVLLIYRHPFRPDASTIMEHVTAFGRHSRFAIWPLNTELGLPGELWSLQFVVIVLHYSLFGFRPFQLGPDFVEYVAQSNAYKVAFFQDEYQLCRERFEFIRRCKIDCVYTLVEPTHWGETYRRYTDVPRLEYCIPGYVGDSLIAVARRLTVPDVKRTVDVGYRTRRLPYYMGVGAQEKHEIALRFGERAARLGLVLDIETTEDKRIYGQNWHRFLANCRGVLGVEAGVSIFDIDDVVYRGYVEIMARNPAITFEELSQMLLHPWENRIPYRTISPRHFEAAAFRVCQILYEGQYSGILQPMVHYIPLRKDFSNFDETIQLFRDPAVRRELTENAYRDLIASGRYSYRSFMTKFNQVLLEAGLQPEISVIARWRITALIRRDIRQWQLYSAFKELEARPFRGKSAFRLLARPLHRAWRRLRRDGAQQA